MKPLLLSLLLALFSTTCVLADSPEAILKDYQKQSAAALTKLNGTLEQSATPLIATLIKAGDTAAAEQLTAQLKAKLAGEPVPTPQASATLLFAQYDQARDKALEPVRKAGITRIDALLSGKEGKNLDTVTELGKVRAEIEGGKAGAASDTSLPVEWVYKHSPTDRVDATIWLNPGSKFLMIDKDNVRKEAGTWSRAADKDTLNIQLENGDKWTVELKDGMGIIHRSVGTRYMLPK